MTYLWKRKEPVGRLEFPQTAQPTVVIFLILRYQRKLFVASSPQNTSSTSCKRLIDVPRRAKLGRSCVEGLYSSNLTTWRRQREQGTLEALSPKHRGPKVKNIDPSVRRIVELERENNQLKQKLKQAETIIDVQKKLSEILQIPPGPAGEKI